MVSAKLLKPVSPLLADSSDDEDMVYAPYYRPGHPHACRKPRRRSHQLDPEVRAEIVARVLDPAYSGRRESSPRVFIDPNGDAHDPDYKLFPTYPRRASQTIMTSPRGFFRRMPSDDDLSRDDDDDSEAEWARVRAASPYTSAASTSSMSPPPLEPVSLFGDDEWDEKEWTREVVVPAAPAKRRKHSKASSEIPRTVYVPATPVIVEPVGAMDDDEYDTPAIAYSRHSAVELVREDTLDSAADETYVAPPYPTTARAYVSAILSPSCGYVLRRQWATFALHTRLSAHRIARRARRVVSVGT
ncbi:hypothetical protein FRC10_006506 [Ceratobasidium sp. 414]|nr:hypothetical protein FRC10_006506 [Ceratobasidium sp. 414]